MPETDTQPLDQNKDDTALKFWWVNHNQNFEEEVGNGYLWAPAETHDGRRLRSHENIKRVRPGNFVFSYARARIQAVGLCTGLKIRAARPKEFGDAGQPRDEDGWYLPVSFTRLENPFRQQSHMDRIAPTLPETHSPIQPNGNGNQSYLAEISAAMAEILIELIGDEAKGVETELQTLLNDISAALEDKRLGERITEEEKLEEDIKNRTDLDETERSQLVKSRRGQGIYRSNLWGFEKACRLSGVINKQHLRASHIKPWRVCTDPERLDGNNGLLLSPHFDHLFDEGYISFENDGTLLVSNQIDSEIIEKWNIDPSQNYGSFRTEQLPYLKYHREMIFKK